MALYHFTLIADTTVVKEQVQFDYPALKFAKGEARSMLTDLVRERLPMGGWEMLSVEIYNDRLEPLTEMRVSFQEIDK